jgi:hypothetical protein
MKDHPEAPSSYHHVSPAELKKLKLYVQIQRIRSEQVCDSKHEHTFREIGWMEHIGHNEDESLSIFTRLNALDDAMSMKIMASTMQRRGERNDMVLCTIKAYENGLVVATPAISTVESDFSANNLFLSTRGAQMIAQQGEPLTTYTVVASNGNQYCYCIECNIIGEPGRGFDLDQTIRQRNDFRRDVLCRQRELIRKDFENSGRLYQDCCRKWSNHASIEIISADGFLHPNILFSMTQPRLMIRYRLIKTSSEGNDVVVLKGHTDRVMKTPAIGSTIEFAVHFTATFVVIIFVSTQTSLLDVFVCKSNKQARHFSFFRS